ARWGYLATIVPELFAACLVEIEFGLGRIDGLQGSFEFADSVRIAPKTVVDDAQLAVRKVVKKVQPVGAGGALIGLGPGKSRLEIGNGFRPKFPSGVGAAALIIVPPTAAPGQARRDAVGLAIFDKDRGALYGTASHTEEEQDEEGKPRYVTSQRALLGS